MRILRIFYENNLLLKSISYTKLKQKNTYYIYIVLLLFNIHNNSAQELTLKLTSKLKSETIVLNKIDYKKRHKDSLSLQSELTIISKYLKTLGYFTSTIDSINKKNETSIAFLSLNNKIKNIKLKTTPHIELIKSISKKTKDTITILPKDLQSFLNKISLKLDEKGLSFSKVKLNNILITNNNLYADLEIKYSKSRNINKVIIKGYKNFPNSFIENYYSLNPNNKFNQQKLKELSNKTKNLQFVSEIKPPETLFTQDSTFIYLYLKKKQNNSFDANVNFASNENGGLLFNGNINLTLKNTLNKGEQLELFWNSVNNERQEFKVSTHTPYIFNSRINPQLAFSIYKQDSTFTNIKLTSKVLYEINNKIKFGFTYNTDTSKKLKNTITSNISSFRNYFLGLNFQYKSPNNDFFHNNKFFIELSPSFGKRSINTKNTNQLKLETTISYLFEINNKSSLFIKNKTGILNSENLINNELFRIGGANSIRGYNEQSIFTENYSFFNFEYRYLTSENSYLYTISDFGRIKANSTKKDLLGLGIGYLFTTNNSQINLSSVVSKTNNQNIDFKDIKLLIKWVNFF